jgi:hypothetical protein
MGAIPIAHLPRDKDSERILVYGISTLGNDEEDTANYSGEMREWYFANWDAADQVFSGDIAGGQIVHVTHWMPEPPAPGN